MSRSDGGLRVDTRLWREFNGTKEAYRNEILPLKYSSAPKHLLVLPAWSKTGDPERRRFASLTIVRKFCSGQNNGMLRAPAQHVGRKDPPAWDRQSRFGTERRHASVLPPSWRSHANGLRLALSTRPRAGAPALRFAKLRRAVQYASSRGRAQRTCPRRAGRMGGLPRRLPGASHGRPMGRHVTRAIAPSIAPGPSRGGDPRDHPARASARWSPPSGHYMLSGPSRCAGRHAAARRPATPKSREGLLPYDRSCERGNQFCAFR